VTQEPDIAALFIEDDVRLARLTGDYLGGHGVRVTHVADGVKGLEEAQRGAWDVVLLDVMLPGKSGLDVCRALRERSDVPVILLTARGEEADKVLGLELGADDYLPKPFSSRELLARISAVVRRARGKVGPGKHSLKVGPLVLDPSSHRAILHGKVLPLTGYEFALLRALAERAGRVLSREQLMELAKGSAEESFDRSIDVHISRLRQKLGGESKRLLKTIRGVGYVLTDEGAAG
jgi:two-component system, OmpR family, response regulator